MKVSRVLPEGWLLTGLPSGGDEALDRAMMELFAEAFELWARKQRDYGPENIAQAGETGVALRLNDKVQRLRTLLTSGMDPQNESRRDTWIDACVYGAIGLALYSGRWPAPQKAPDRCDTCGRHF